MARDPLTGRNLPRGVKVVGRVPPRFEVRDLSNRFLPSYVADAVVRDTRDLPLSREDRIISMAWRAMETGMTQGATPRDLSAQEQELISDWLAGRNIHGKMSTDPRDDPSRIERLRAIALFGGGGSHHILDFAVGALGRIVPGSRNPRKPPEDAFVVTRETIKRKERKGRWLVSEEATPNLPRFWNATRTRQGIVVYEGHEPYRVANMEDWRAVDPSLPSDTLACAQAILRVGVQLGLHPGLTPAGLAWRYLRTFVKDWSAYHPAEANRMCANTNQLTYFIFSPGHKKEATAYIYDMNCAYGAFLREVPDLSTGQIVHVSKWAGPFGIYESEGNVISGLALAEGLGDRYYERLMDHITEGWAWVGDWNAPSPFRRFVETCYGWQGPHPKLLRRFPALVVGKTASIQFIDEEWVAWPAASYYPMIWTNVTGGLFGRMLKTARESDMICAYIDNLHTRTPLDPCLIGEGIGYFKLVDVGATRYEGLNRFQSPHLERHQGVRK